MPVSGQKKKKKREKGNEGKILCDYVMCVCVCVIEREKIKKRE